MLTKPNPVVTVIDEATNEVVYALRINGKDFQPKVFKKGVYTVVVDDGTPKTKSGRNRRGE